MTNPSLQNTVDPAVIIIGAGPAGLAVGACLKGAGISFVILEQGDSVAVAWRRHYDRLHLHTDKRNSELPFAPYPKEYPRYPSKYQLIEYLENYANRFQLDIRYNQKVISARKAGRVWEVQTQTEVFRAQKLVVATGYARQTLIPDWPGRSVYQGEVLHSSEYKNGSRFKDRDVLVVGFGNSGGEIAVDLFEHGARPSLAVRNAVNVIPRELAGVPILSIGIVQNKMPAWLADAVNAPILRAVIGDITKYGLRKLPYGPATQIARDRRIPLIDVGTMNLIKQGNIKVYPGMKAFTENGVQFDDGREAKFDAIVLATGYRPRVNDFLKDVNSAYDEEGTPLSTGRESLVSGLYFCGYYVSPTGMLREIAMEARRISAAIVQTKIDGN
jgi:cation diffusion facilitator CzcD-associated flavoprotein CzcO